MRDTLLAAGGAVLVAGLNELRAQLRAREADRDRREALSRARVCDGFSCSPGGSDHGGCGCDDPEE